MSVMVIIAIDIKLYLYVRSLETCPYIRMERIEGRPPVILENGIKEYV